MAKKTYEVKTPLQLGTKDGVDAVDVGSVIDLEEKTAAPLVAVGALVEQIKAEKVKA